MPSHDSKTRARAELVDLIESQLNTLEKETFRRRNRGRTLPIRGQARPHLSAPRGTHRQLKSRRVACSGCQEEIKK